MKKRELERRVAKLEREVEELRLVRDYWPVYPCPPHPSYPYPQQPAWRIHWGDTTWSPTDYTATSSGGA